LRTRLLASLIVCVALLTQFGVSLWGATTARDGFPGCHRPVDGYAAAAVVDPAPAASQKAPAQTPAKPDHACCSLCELSFGFLGSDAPVFETHVAVRRLVRFGAPADMDVIAVFNRSAPARAPPSQA
jgi:hypothetical protein